MERTPATGGAAPAAHSRILEGLLTDAAIRGERAVAVLRAAVLLLLLVRRVVHSSAELAAGDIKVWLIVGGLVAGCIGAAVSYRLLRRGRLRPALNLSVMTDAMVVFLTVLPRALWAPDFTGGILNDLTTAGFMLMAAATGIRLSPTVARLGIGANAAALVTLLVVERLLWGGTIDYGAGQYPMAVIFFLGAAGIGWATTIRTRQLVFDGARAALLAERARQRLGIYVSEEIADVALDEGELLPGGVRREVAVLFSDLRGFTDYAERLAPEELVGELNAYLDAMVAAVKEHGGVVDKYIGDSIMVVFGIPRGDGSEAIRALRTARAMEAALTRHNRERRRRGRPPLRHGIGIHYGHAIAGNIGARGRLQFTVVGDVVNTASRLEAATKEEGVSVLVSAAAVAASGGEEALPGLRRHSFIRVRGRNGGIEVYALTG